ncbi:response regulator [Geodermatophilus sp. SYSU D01176]
MLMQNSKTWGPPPGQLTAGDDKKRGSTDLGGERRADARIALIADYALFREGLREMLANVDDFTVVAEADDAGRAVAVVSRYRPDVVLLDVQTTDIDVTATVRSIRQHSLEPRIIILAVHEDANLLHRLLALGIDGYLIKKTTRQQLVAAIRSSLDRDDAVMVSVPRVAVTGRAAAGEPASASLLSRRELEVLRLVGHAFTNAQIARRLSLTEATVKRHLYNVFNKLGAVSRIDALNRAIAAGLLPSPEPSRPVLAPARRAPLPSPSLPPTSAAGRPPSDDSPFGSRSPAPRGRSLHPAAPRSGAARSRQV